MCKDIRNLDEILLILKLCCFPESRWLELGLMLGLLHPTLKTIEKDYPHDTSRCFLECLTKWLMRADNVEITGLPTFDLLAECLCRLKENAVAKKLTEIG